jgi:trypsin
VKNSIRVVVGSSFLSSGGIAHTAQDYIIHPDYNPFQYKNDVALLKTSTTISFTQSVKPIILGFDFVGGGVNAILSGWVSV